MREDNDVPDGEEGKFLRNNEFLSLLIL